MSKAVSPKLYQTFVDYQNEMARANGNVRIGFTEAYLLLA